MPIFISGFYPQQDVETKCLLALTFVEIPEYSEVGLQVCVLSVRKKYVVKLHGKLKMSMQISKGNSFIFLFLLNLIYLNIVCLFGGIMPEASELRRIRFNVLTLTCLFMHDLIT